jgi:hypothetical protein
MQSINTFMGYQKVAGEYMLFSLDMVNIYIHACIKMYLFLGIVVLHIMLTTK